MGNIVLLDDLTINQIAAGEVIERPASAIKEMLENSIDAGAKNVTIEIKNGGISLIRITDDGSGIAADDMEIAFERHATSKIRKAEDLITVKSMGFRGEALASIAAISKVEMISKRIGSEIGNKIVLEGGDVLEKSEIGAPVGTRITVENLFYNTPVRYKFLKKDYTETGYIEDVVTRIALVNKNVSITLISNGKTILHTAGNGDSKSVIYSVFGKDIANGIIDVDYTYEDIKVTGVIGNTSIAKSNRSSQLFFINNRYVKDKTLIAAVDQAYRNILPIGKYAFSVLNIEMDPSKVDVNVHPAKLEVRFQDESSVCKAVYHAIKSIMDSKESEKLIAKKTENTVLNEIKANSINASKELNNSVQSDVKKDIPSVSMNQSEISPKAIEKENTEKIEHDVELVDSTNQEEKQEKTSALGNLFKKFWKDKKDEEPEKNENNLLKEIYDSRKNEKENTRELDFNVNDKLKEIVANTIENVNIDSVQNEKTTETPTELAENTSNIEETQVIENIKNQDTNNDVVKVINEEIKQETQVVEPISSEEIKAENTETDNIVANDTEKDTSETKILDTSMVQETQKIDCINQYTQEIKDTSATNQEQYTQKIDSIPASSEMQKTQKFDFVQTKDEVQHTQEIECVPASMKTQYTQEIDSVKISTEIQDKVKENQQSGNLADFVDGQHTQIMNLKAEDFKVNNNDDSANTNNTYNEAEEKEIKVENFDTANSITEKLLEQKFKEDMQDTQMIDTSKVREALKEQETPKEFEEMYKKTFGIETVAVRKEKEQEEKEISASDGFKYANQENESMFEKEEFKQKINYKFIGIVFEKYITIEISNEMYMIDYGAMYERLMYEDFKNNYYNDEKKDSQILLLPDIITLTNKEMFIAKQNLSMFEKAGFQYEEFGENTIKLTAVPSVCEKLNTKKLFIEILDELNTVAVTENEEKEKKFIATIAYKATEKTNLKIEESEIDKLLQRLLSLENPFTYPYGRPSAIKMTRYDLERKFSRR